MSSWWWMALLAAGMICAIAGLALGATARHSASSAVVLLSAVAILTAGILGLVL